MRNNESKKRKGSSFTYLKEKCKMLEVASEKQFHHQWAIK
jgi:hypothetical protein